MKIKSSAIIGVEKDYNRIVTNIHKYNIGDIVNINKKTYEAEKYKLYIKKEGFLIGVYRCVRPFYGDTYRKALLDDIKILGDEYQDLEYYIYKHNLTDSCYISEDKEYPIRIKPHINICTKHLGILSLIPDVEEIGDDILNTLLKRDDLIIEVERDVLNCVPQDINFLFQ